MLPKQAFTGFAARYNPPNLDEGFTDITKVDFEVSCNCCFLRAKTLLRKQLAECNWLSRIVNF